MKKFIFTSYIDLGYNRKSVKDRKESERASPLRREAKQYRRCGGYLAAEEIRKMIELEEDLRRQQAAAETESKRRIQLARRAGERQLEDNHRIIEAERRSKMAQAEAQAAQETEEVLRLAAERCEEEKRAARARLEAVYDWIAERVVGD